jgi:hypothetical protein
MVAIMTDKKLVRFAAEFRSGLLSGRPPDGMCAAVCFPLATLLQVTLGVNVWCEEIIFSEGGPLGVSNHVFLRLGDGRVLDPTADQFGLDPVYLGPLPALYEEHRA